jgi:nucleoid-associated protein YgaU
MGSRYNNKTIFRNENETYEEILDRRKVPYIRQFGTSTMVTPTVRQIRSFSKVQHIWKAGDRFWKLSTRYYDNPQYWWVIALFNKLPTEAHVRNGEILTIPLPLERVLRTIRG